MSTASGRAGKFEAMAPTANQRQIVILEAEMQAAVAEEDFERAARLRDRIANLRSEWETPAPGGEAGGRPAVEPPKDWQRPKKPDPMTKNAKLRRPRW